MKTKTSRVKTSRRTPRRDAARSRRRPSSRLSSSRQTKPASSRPLPPSCFRDSSLTGSSHPARVDSICFSLAPMPARSRRRFLREVLPRWEKGVRDAYRYRYPRIARRCRESKRRRRFDSPRRVARLSSAARCRRTRASRWRARARTRAPPRRARASAYARPSRSGRRTRWRTPRSIARPGGTPSRRRGAIDRAWIGIGIGIGIRRADAMRRAVTNDGVSSRTTTTFPSTFPQTRDAKTLKTLKTSKTFPSPCSRARRTGASPRCSRCAPSSARRTPPRWIEGGARRQRRTAKARFYPKTPFLRWLCARAFCKVRAALGTA